QPATPPPRQRLIGSSTSYGPDVLNEPRHQPRGRWHRVVRYCSPSRPKVVNDHEPMIPSGDGQIAETRKRQTAGAFTDVNQSSRSPQFGCERQGNFLSGLVDWRHASVAVLLPCGCHGVWPNVLDRAVTDL